MQWAEFNAEITAFAPFRQNYQHPIFSFVYQDFISFLLVHKFNLEFAFGSLSKVLYFFPNYPNNCEWLQPLFSRLRPLRLPWHFRSQYLPRQKHPEYWWHQFLGQLRYNPIYWCLVQEQF